MRSKYFLIFCSVITCIVLFYWQDLSAQQTAYALRFPTHKYEVTGYYFGDTNGGDGVHVGEDIILDPGTPVYAMAIGDVKLVKINSDGYEQVVVIEHILPSGEKVCSIYGHLSEKPEYPLTSTGSINIGDIVGYVGWDDENGIGGPHLHFGVRKGAYCGLYEGRASTTNDFYDPTDFIKSKSPAALGNF